jgi:hypothetical protein
MKVAIHQPHYMPWLGYLAKWAAADLLIFLDTVQYEKNGWQNRNRINTPEGPRWLTVPVRARLGMPITDVEIDTRQDWGRRHLRAIEHAYARAPHLARHASALAALYAQSWARLAPLALATARWLASAVGIATPTRVASELRVDATDPTGRLVALCQAAGATEYLAGRDGVEYLDLRQFKAAGVAVRIQDYTHPVYAQPHGKFVPNLSGLDLLLTHGDDALAILRRGDGWSELSG